jgi:hypothetical protein
VFATGPGQLFRNDLAGGAHWLHLDLVGTVSNRSAIGARVVVLAGGVRRIREVAGSTSFGSQNSLTVEFGLGTAASVESLTVRWPSGIVQAVGGLAVDARHTIVEGAATAVADPAVSGPRLSTARPNPARDEVHFEIEAMHAGLARLTIHDLSGRLVGMPAETRIGMGRHTVVWDARRGNRVAPGIYFARLRWIDDAGRASERFQRFVIAR